MIHIYVNVYICMLYTNKYVPTSGVSSHALRRTHTAKPLLVALDVFNDQTHFGR